MLAGRALLLKLLSPPSEPTEPSPHVRPPMPSVGRAALGRAPSRRGSRTPLRSPSMQTIAEEAEGGEAGASEGQIGVEHGHVARGQEDAKDVGVVQDGEAIICYGRSSKQDHRGGCHQQDACSSSHRRMSGEQDTCCSGHEGHASFVRGLAAIRASG